MEHPIHRITHRNGDVVDMAIDTAMLTRAQGGDDGAQKSIAIAFGFELLAQNERASHRPYIVFDDLIIDDPPPFGHRD